MPLDAAWGRLDLTFLQLGQCATQSFGAAYAGVSERERVEFMSALPQAAAGVELTCPGTGLPITLPAWSPRALPATVWDTQASGHR